MVSTRVVIALGAFAILLGFGFGWVGFTGNPSGYTYLDVLNAFGSTYGACGCPPDSSTIQGEFLLLLMPILASPGPMLVSMLLYPVGFVLAGISFFRWRVMWVAGTTVLLSGVLWFIGVYLNQASMVKGLQAWSGTGTAAGTYSIWVQLGAYCALFGGTILLFGYALSRMDVLNWAVD